MLILSLCIKQQKIFQNFFWREPTKKVEGDITSSNITKHRFSMGTSRNPSNTPAILSFPLRIWGVHFRCLVADVAGMMCKKSPFLLLFDFLLVRHLLPSLLSKTDNFNFNLLIISIIICSCTYTVFPNFMLSCKIFLSYSSD